MYTITRLTCYLNKLSKVLLKKTYITSLTCNFYPEEIPV